jgi:hypothetical protein
MRRLNSALDLAIDKMQLRQGRPILQRMDDLRPANVRWLWPGKIPAGKLTLGKQKGSERFFNSSDPFLFPALPHQRPGQGRRHSDGGVGAVPARRVEARGCSRASSIELAHLRIIPVSGISRHMSSVTP